MDTILSHVNPIHINVLENSSYLYPYAKICMFVCMYVCMYVFITSPIKKAKFTLEQTIKAQRGSGGIAPPVL